MNICIYTIGECKSPGALKWGLQDGKLYYNDGKRCLARLYDNTLEVTKCSTAYEYIFMDVPSTYSYVTVYN
jgi:hypothetical protein